MTTAETYCDALLATEDEAARINQEARDNAYSPTLALTWATILIVRAIRQAAEYLVAVIREERS
jgi:hypothetical protein